MPEGAPSDNPADKLVVIVDDDDSVRELIEFLVKKEGFRAETASDGEAGIAKIQQTRPNLVVLDLMLPRYGGFEVLRQLQQSEETARIPIVVVTGRYTDRSTAEMIRQESNVMDFIEKPIKPTLFSVALHKIMGTRPRLESGGAI